MAEEKTVNRMDAKSYLRKLREERKLHLVVHGNDEVADCMYIHLMYASLTFYTMGLLTSEDFGRFMMLLFEDMDD